MQIHGHGELRLAQVLDFRYDSCNKTMMARFHCCLDSSATINKIIVIKEAPRNKHKRPVLSDQHRSVD